MFLWLSCQDFEGIASLVTLWPEGFLSGGLKMYMVESKGGAIVCMCLALLFLGTWPALLTLLERRGRLPQHTYLDYTITNLLAAVIIAFTFGEIGSERPNFLDQVTQDNWQSVLFAMAGGIVLSLGNLATQYAWAFVGLSVTEVVSSSITVVIGTTLNYFLDDKINKAEILFPGVGCFLVAVCLGSAVHASNAADNKKKLSGFSGHSKYGAENQSMSPSNETHMNSVGKNDLENGLASVEKAKFGTALYLIQLENKRSIKVVILDSILASIIAIFPNRDDLFLEMNIDYTKPNMGTVFGKGTVIGLVITFFSGVCFSLFSPAFNLATNDQWHTLKDGVPHLTVYTAFFYFSVSCFILAIILNISFLYRPVLNAPKSSFKAYLSDWNGRGWALLAGLLCGFGNGLQFMGGQAAGYAAADAVQALPLVSTFWGVILFGEYRRSSRRTYMFLAGMLSMFIIAVGVLMGSSGHRK
nr:ureide permease 1-like isoform X1 [Ipomoea batatas]